MPPAPATSDPADPGTDPEAGRVQELDERFGALEREQREQRGILERVAAAVAGKDGGPQGDGPGSAAAGAAAPSIAQQVRDEIAAADQRRRSEEDEKTWRAGVSEVVEKVKAESAPRPTETGPRAVARRLIFGKDA